MPPEEPPSPYAPVVIKLLQGVVYSDDNPYWDQLQNYLTPVKEYFGKIGLRVRNYETQGFAYVEQPDPDPDEPTSVRLPRLTVRHRLSFKTTVLYILLREQISQFDASSDTGRLVLSIEQLRDLLQPYLKESNNEARSRTEVDQLVREATRVGFLKQLSGKVRNYEVCPIIKAKIDADTLELLKQKLESISPEDYDHESTA